MDSYRYLLDLALILLTTKVFGLVTRRFHMPQVVGALVAGLVFGPAALGLLHGSDFLSRISELGVIFIMFTAGMDTNLNELRKTGKAGFWVALIGVLVPLVMGTGLGFIFNRGDLAAPGVPLLQNIFIGAVLTATSVSITVEALKEMGKLNGKVGTTILAAALIDDILGLLCLTILIAFTGQSDVQVSIVLLKIVGFFAFTIVVGLSVRAFLAWYQRKVGKPWLQRFMVLSFVLCLLMAYCANRLFGVADIIGAFAAGLVIGSLPNSQSAQRKFMPLSYLLLAPVFFANVGLNVAIPQMTLTVALFTVCLIIVAVVSKLVGCGLGARLCGMNAKESMQVGLGMVCRGEVALIVANQGRALNLIPPVFIGPLIVMVVLTTILTPVLLKLVFKDESGNEKPSELVAQYEEGLKEVH